MNKEKEEFLQRGRGNRDQKEERTKKDPVCTQG